MAMACGRPGIVWLRCPASVRRVGAGLARDDFPSEQFGAPLAASLIPCNSVYRGYDCDEVEVPLLTPLGVPEEFPTSLPPALQKIRRPWKTLVHIDGWGNPLKAAD